MVRLGESIINLKKENQFDDAVFSRNLSDRGISGLQYFWDYAIHNLYKKLGNWNKYKRDGFQQSTTLLSAWRLTITEMLQNQKLFSALNRGGLWIISEDMQKIFSCCKEVFYKYFSKNFFNHVIRHSLLTFFGVRLKIPMPFVLLLLPQFMIQQLSPGIVYFVVARFS